MAMQHSKEYLGEIGDTDLAKILDGIQGVFQKRHPEMKDIPLPESQVLKGGKTATPETLPPSGLEPVRFAIEIPIVNAEDYKKTREAVEAAIKGVFITSIRSVSIEALLAEDLKRGEERRFNHSWISSSKIMRATSPPSMEVFIDPNAVRIEGSNRMSADEQKAKIAQAAASFKKKLPEEVRGFVGLYMVDPSTYSQLEDAWMDVGKGLLLPDYFARTDVVTVESFVANVGRNGATDRRGVLGWVRGHGHGHVFAVPVGVLPQKLAV